MKYSKQRQLIENAVIMNRIHPTADDVYVMLKPENANLSLGTVYRNLNLLAENGVIKKLSIPNSSDRFDGDLSEHYHIICNECNKVTDVRLCIKDMLDDEVKKQTGVTGLTYQIVASGVCNDCKNKKVISKKVI